MLLIMSNGFNLSDVILIAATCMIIKKLVNVLGVASNDISVSDKVMKVVTPIEDEPKSGVSKIIALCRPNKSSVKDALSPEAEKAIKVIKQYDISFEPRRFVKIVMDKHISMIEALNSGALKGIKSDCSDMVYNQLNDHMTNNKNRGFLVKQKIAKYDSVDIIDAQQLGGHDYLKVRVKLQLARMVYNRDGDLIAGDPAELSDVTDELMLRKDSIKNKWQIWEIGSSLISNEVGSGV